MKLQMQLLGMMTLSGESLVWCWLLKCCPALVPSSACALLSIQMHVECDGVLSSKGNGAVSNAARACNLQAQMACCTPMQFWTCVCPHASRKLNVCILTTRIGALQNTPTHTSRCLQCIFAHDGVVPALPIQCSTQHTFTQLKKRQKQSAEYQKLNLILANQPLANR